MFCLCPGCSKKIKSEMLKCPFCNEPLKLKNRYLLKKILSDNQAITYLAQNTKPLKKVIIKELSIHRLKRWKDEELFNREIKVLKQLSHPKIPKYLDNFRIESRRHNIHYLIKEYIEGITLKEKIKTYRFSETEVLKILLEVLEILIYLQDLNPPIIHRDIKLSNLICDREGNIYLIDFGVVRDLIKSTIQGDTITGTFGYMAPEQFLGKAVKQTDIYSLGVAAVVLLSQTSPEKMMGHNNVLDWRSHVRLSRPLFRLISDFLEITPENRPHNAQEAFDKTKSALAEIHSGTVSDELSLENRKKKHYTKDNIFQIIPQNEFSIIHTSMESWTRIIDDYNNIPDRYKYEIKEDINNLFYIVFIPKNDQNNEKLLYIHNRTITQMEKVSGKIITTNIGFDEIIYLTHSEILLDSYIKIVSKSKNITVNFNSVNSRKFYPFIYTAREKKFSKAIAEYNIDKYKNEQNKMNYLKNINYKFYNYSIKSLIPGVTIKSSLFQPDFRIKKDYYPNQLVLLTSKELILFGEKAIGKKHQEGESNYGIITTYIPVCNLNSIYSSKSHINISLQNNEVLQLINSEKNTGTLNFYEQLRFLLNNEDAAKHLITKSGI